MKILLAYPGPRHSTFDVAHGWSGALSELGHDASEYRYDYVIDFFICAYRAWENKHPGNPEAKFKNELWQSAASKQLVIQAVHDQPDIVLMISGLQYHPHAFELLHKLKIPIVLIFTESPYLDSRQAITIERGGVSLAFTSDKVSVGPLSGLGCPVVYLPHSYDPIIHHNGPSDEDYETGIYFCGTLWADRKAMFSGLISDRRSLQAEFDAYIHGPDMHRGGFEVVPNAENAEWYRSTKIALNHHRRAYGDFRVDEGRLTDGAAWSINPRTYEIAACGAFQLCDDGRAELREIFGDSVATYADNPDLIDKIRYYLTHDAERGQMAARANELVRDCTFVNRAQDILIPAIQQHLGG